MLYGIEYWMVKNQHANRICVVEIEMLRNRGRVGALGVTAYYKKMVKTQLRWIGHIERRFVDFVARRVDQMEGGQITKRQRKT
jgi:hypothetical protein